MRIAHPLKPSAQTATVCDDDLSHTVYLAPNTMELVLPNDIGSPFAVACIAQPEPLVSISLWDVFLALAGVTWSTWDSIA